MHSDDQPLGRVLSRRQALTVLGVAGVGLTIGEIDGASASSASSQGAVTGPVDCVAKPEMTVGPYFVDEGLNRSDIRADPSDGSIVDGTPLLLNLNIAQITGGKCLPLPGAKVDIWQCDAFGLYSDVEYEGTVGRKFLRGYQVTDRRGGTTFVTILPGWYPSRTIHIHVKVRTTGTDGNPYEFTSQLYFDEAFKAAYLATDPYASTGTPDTTNDTDIWYGEVGAQMHLAPRRKGTGYEATFTIGLDLSDTAVGAPDVFTVPTAPPST
ncbi:hypothetical protein [Streptomyces sp. NPDC046862]|uniref:dioxygenase family protein n=1 Tax=Streptomyces sp. NPDC046862 TaxID=3154603 RepID=UPI003455F7F0